MIISADTVVFVYNQIIGKPNTKENVREILGKLSGKTHEIITGLTIIDIENEKSVQEHEITKVKMKDLTNQEINDYIKSEEPLGKAGSFAIQGIGAIFIERIEGCYFNVVGLPLFKLNKILKELGISIFDYLS